MPKPGEPISCDLASLLDRLAALTQTPDTTFAELRLCQDGDRLRVPLTVRNAVRDREEAI